MTFEQAFASFLSTTKAYAASYDAAAKAAGVTNDIEQPLLDAYPALTSAAEKSLDFLRTYKTALGEDVAAVLLWAGKDLSGRDVVCGLD